MIAPPEFPEIISQLERRIFLPPGATNCLFRMEPETTLHFLISKISV
jgi:hypothetical protein